MKYFKFFLFFVLALLGSCVSFDSGENAAWVQAGKNIKGNVRVLSVSAEKSGDWSSLEKEASDLLPLLFLEEGYLVVSMPGDEPRIGDGTAQAGVPARADYSVEVKVREREYPDGWQTKRSLSAEVRIWAGDNFSGQQSARLPPVPLSAGQALIQGKQTLASSGTLSGMLRTALRNAVQGFPLKEGSALSGSGAGR